MSNTEVEPEEVVAHGGERAAELITPREVPLGGPRAMLVRRTLPTRSRSLVGAWCFLDQYGPHDVGDGAGMQVPPHPHIGLQTVTWLLSGAVDHRDSVGSVQQVRPGALSLMTAGSGIAHSERSPVRDGVAHGVLHGVQLWVALPSAARDQAPGFEHHDALPQTVVDGAEVTVFLGAWEGMRSPARTHSPILGAEVRPGPGPATLALDPEHEHAVLAASGTLVVDGTTVLAGSLLHLPGGATQTVLAAAGADVAAGADDDPPVALLLGGAPFGEDVVMWWNFVARSHEEIVQARQRWEAGDLTPAVVGDAENRLPAPALPNARITPRQQG